ncbi:MAG: hypothetical protein M9962_08730 [Oligoflexia bacterium]|nr:hypothetical protein [Oligoflexia bacterium]
MASHANESLNNGFEIEFLRQGKGNSSLKGKLFAQGQTWEVTNQFDAIHADDFIQLQIDVHNDESPSHIIIWNRSNGDDFSEGSAVLNSAEEIDGSPGIGVGTRWGVKLNNGALFRAEKMDPKFEE